MVEIVRNLMAHAQKPHFVFRLNGRVHLNRRGSQFSWLLAAEVCASGLVMLDTPPSEVVWEYLLPTPFASFPFTSPPVHHHVPPHSERSIQRYWFFFQTIMLPPPKRQMQAGWSSAGLQCNSTAVKQTGGRIYELCTFHDCALQSIYTM
jgi:hypothetical protein